MTTASPYRLVWALLVFAWISNYLVRIALSALLPPIMRELDLSYTNAGLLATAFFSAYAAMQLPAGILGDRFGRRRILTLGVVGGALASAATGLSTSFAALLLARLFTGACQGSLFSNDRAIIASVTPADKAALGQGVSFTGPGVGICLGLLLGGVLGEHLPWRSVFLLFALPPIAAAVLIHRYVPAGPRSAPASSAGGRLRVVLRHPDLWILGVAGTTAMWIEFVLLTWSPLLFMEVGVRDLGHAGLSSSVLGVAAIGGLIVGGWLGDRARRLGFGERGVLIGCFLATALFTGGTAAVVGSWPSPAALTVALFAANFGAWSVWGPSLAVLGKVMRADDLGTAFGLYNTLTVVGAVIGPGVTGWTRDMTGSFAVGLYLAAAVGLIGAGVVMALGSSRGPVATGLQNV